MQQAVFKNVPEFFEQDFGEAVNARTEILNQFKDMGPPDLCHFIKLDKKQNKELSSFHFVTGLDVSSPATFAAYVNLLSYQMEDLNQWFQGSSSNSSGKPSTFQIKMGQLCSWNAFSHLDTRIEVKIPGGVEAYAVDPDSKMKLQMTEEMWLETFLSGLIRSLLMDVDNPLFPAEFSSFVLSSQFYQNVLIQIGVRHLNPINNEKEESRFLEVAQKLFHKGWQLGCENSFVTPSLLNNHLTKALMLYFEGFKRLEKGKTFFEALLEQFPEVSALIGKLMYASGQEQEAMKFLCDYQMKIPLQAEDLMLIQADILNETRNMKQEALKLTQYAVEIQPGDPQNWLKLSETFNQLEEYGNALCCLNSCPTLTLINGQSPTFTDGGVFLNFIEIFRQIPAPVKKFLPIQDQAQLPAEIQEELTHPSNQTATSPSPVSNTSEAASQNPLQDPLLFFAGGSRFRDACDVNLFRLSAPQLKGNLKRAYLVLSYIAFKVGWDQLLKIRSEVFIMEDEYKQVKDQNNLDSEKPWQGSGHLTVNMFEKKRLCERWLDQLFMVLYEDLKVYMIFKAEMDNALQSKKAYKRTSLEWELLGDLCDRLHYKQQAKECFQFYVEKRYNFRVWFKLLQIYLSEGKPNTILASCEKLLSFMDRWRFGDLIHPTNPVCKAIFTLVQWQSASQLKSTVLSMKMPKRNEQLLIKIIERIEKFK